MCPCSYSLPYSCLFLATYISSFEIKKLISKIFHFSGSIVNFNSAQWTEFASGRQCATFNSQTANLAVKAFLQPEYCSAGLPYICYKEIPAETEEFFAPTDGKFFISCWLLHKLIILTNSLVKIIGNYYYTLLGNYRELGVGKLFCPFKLQVRRMNCLILTIADY